MFFIIIYFFSLGSARWGCTVLEKNDVAPSYYLILSILCYFYDIYCILWYEKPPANLTTYTPPPSEMRSNLLFHSLSLFFFHLIFTLIPPSSSLPFSLLYSTWHAPSCSVSFPVWLYLLRYLSLLVSLSLSALSHVFFLFLTSGSLVLIVLSPGKSHRRAVQSCKPPMTPSLFPTRFTEHREHTNTHTRYTAMQTCNNSKAQTARTHTQAYITAACCVIERNIYLFVLILCWLCETL